MTPIFHKFLRPLLTLVVMVFCCGSEALWAMRNKDFILQESDVTQTTAWHRSLLHQKSLEKAIKDAQKADHKLPASWRYFRSGDLGMILDFRGDGVEVISLFDLKEQKEFLSENRAPLFTVRMGKKTEEKQPELIATHGWQKITLTTKDRSFKIQFFAAKPKWSEKVLESITVEATAEPQDSAWKWNIVIDNASSPWSVNQVSFPQINTRAYGEATRAFLPIGSGLVVPQPFLEKGPHSTEQILDYQATYPASNNSQYTAANMPFMAVYPEQSEDSPKNGLYVARHDPTGSLKELSLKADVETQTLQFSFRQPAIDRYSPGNVFELGGSGVWKLLSGDWYDAAVYYKKWVTQEAPWWPEINENGRVDIPEWYKKLNFIVWMGDTHPSQIRAARQLKKDFNLPIAIHWTAWNTTGFDNDYPNYLPASKSFLERKREAQTDGFFIIPYINGSIWDTRDRKLEDYRFTKEALPWAVKDANNNLSISPFGVEENGEKGRFAMMCPGTPFWQNTISDTAVEVVTKLGANGIYIDQLGQVIPLDCMDPTHPHPGGAAGHWWRDGNVKLLERIRKNLPPDSIMMTEGTPEIYIKQLDSLLGIMWRYNGQVPAFPVVYGEAVSIYGHRYGTRGGETSSLEFRMKWAQEFIFGMQFGYTSVFMPYQKEIDQKTRDYIVQLSHARDHIQSYIYAGEMQRPPEVKNAPSLTATWHWIGEYANFPVTMDAVVSASWKKPGARKMVLAFTNLSEDSFSQSYEFNPSKYGMNKEPYKIRIQNGTKNWIEAETTDSTEHQGKTTIKLDLPALSTKLVFIEW